MILFIIMTPVLTEPSPYTQALALYLSCTSVMLECIPLLATVYNTFSLRLCGSAVPGLLISLYLAPKQLLSDLIRGGVCAHSLRGVDAWLALDLGNAEHDFGENNGIASLACVRRWI